MTDDSVPKTNTIAWNYGAKMGPDGLPQKKPVHLATPKPTTFPKPRKTSVAEKNPEIMATALTVEALDEFAPIFKTLKDAGVSHDSAIGIVESLRGRFSDVQNKVKGLVRPQFLESIEDVLGRVLGSVTDQDIAEASLKDKMIAVGILVEKRALLRGEPTMILSVEERARVNENIPLLIREAQRRGLTVNAEFKDVTPAVAEAVADAEADADAREHAPEPT
jgi:hypothetical protein